MRKRLVGLFGAATLTIATGAQAAVTIDADNVDVAVADDHGSTFALAFGELGGGSPFDHFITFTETLDGTYGFTVTTTATTNGAGGPIVAATDVDFTHIWLSDDTGGTWDLLADADNTDLNEDYDLANLFLPAGTYTLHFQGTRGRNSEYTGGIAFSAVPEPATWGMMLLGFGGIGYAMRRRRRTALLQFS